ncbi:putative baseplate assembly protein [Rhizobium sp. BK251]|uniref:putative baseplate assembly protein n=1 Tax=Rhizobium sp. BK251 TaxID=2512125 RepID=UPI001050632C|nr:putative baseplate assembly protein [Rhizobium sp. BK251]TCL69496.1 putative phage baseplate assembly protein [Rhizobium sp. BK251]
MRYHCCDLRRLSVLRRSGSANAIDFIEVLDKDAPPGAPRQQTLFVRLLRTGFNITPDNLRITGGERIRTVGIVWSATADALPPEAEPGLVDTVDDLPRTLVIRTDSSGDFSTYTLSIVANSGSSNPPAGFDPILSSIEFSFKVECPADFDCADTHACPPELRPRPDIDYLAKDFQGFRRLMLDRLNLLVPGWTERSAADLGVMLVELLAYAADNLSYRQDAIANEAYLATARQRISVRRHARLVDYFMHEGCNARAFVHFDVNEADVTLPTRTQLLTEVPGLPPVIAPASIELTKALAANPLIFETTHDAVLHSQLNRLFFYAWGDSGCCLPKGATSATLRDHLDTLQVGDILIFEEVVSPTTFSEDDVDLTHRWAVRLTSVVHSSDPSGQLFDEPPVDGPVDVTEIAWDAADALPFALCLSVEERPGLEISVALGNIVLVDHGATIEGEALGEVPEHVLEVAAEETGCGCDAPDAVPVPPRFRPALENKPLAHGFDLPKLLSVPIDPDNAWWPASSLLSIDARSAKPLITDLEGTSGAAPPDSWTVQRDLMSSVAGATDFVVEVEDDGTAKLRFGDDDRGKRPDPGTNFSITYRVGNGAVGNVGADAIFHIVSPSNGVFDALRNPMPAAGGTEPENIETVRRDAPQAFRTQERAVTAADYAAAAERRPDVQRAAATFRWTGSWHTVFITPDRFGGGEIDATFRTRMRRHLERFRMAGYDLDVSSPRYVPLDVALHICVKDDYFRADVLHAVEKVLSSTALSDGRLGLFHPDNFTFGQPAYLSQVIAAAQAVEGVEAVRADRFQRLANPEPTSLDEGVIDIGGLEIAQLANNPNFRERGKLEISAGGGK